MVISIIARFVFILSSNHLYYPDEIFQTLEPAFAHISGFGIQAWEYEAGIRPLVVPLLLSLPLKVFHTLSQGNPQVYTLLMKVLLSTWSIVIPLAVFQIVKNFYASNRRAVYYGLLSGLLAAVWFELMYVAPRALYETLSLNLLATAYLIYIRGVASRKTTFTKEVLYALSGGLIACALVVRPQLMVVLPIGFYWLLSQNLLFKNRLLFGGLLSVVAIGTIEYLQTGLFMNSVLRYLELQLTTPISNIFGVESWLFYPTALLATSGVVLIPALITLNHKASRLWWLIALTLVAGHSLVAHKELRFVLPVVPVIIILFGQSLDTWHQRLKRKVKYMPEILTSCAACISLLSLLYMLPWIRGFYTVPPLHKDPLLAIANAVYQDASVCGIFDVSRTWPISLSYYLINRQVPLYAKDYPPPHFDVISHQLTQSNESIAVTVKQPSVCAVDTNYTYNRTFPEIASLLRKHQFLRVE